MLGPITTNVPPGLSIVRVIALPGVEARYSWLDVRYVPEKLELDNAL